MRIKEAPDGVFEPLEPCRLVNLTPVWEMPGACVRKRLLLDTPSDELREVVWTSTSKTDRQVAD